MTRFITLTAAAALAVLAIAACGSSTDHRQKTATATQAGLEMASCMRANGVPNFPDPTNNTSGTISVHASGLGNILTVNGVSVNAPAFQSAMARCQEYLPYRTCVDDPVRQDQAGRTGDGQVHAFPRSHQLPRPHRL